MGYPEDDVGRSRQAGRNSIARMIRKYSNRRLYDTVDSRYICLGDIRKLVSRGIRFSVVDGHTGADITRSVLLLALTEQEESGEPTLSREFLTDMIRVRETGEGTALGRYLEQSLELFLTQAAATEKDAVTESPEACKT